MYIGEILLFALFIAYLEYVTAFDAENVKWLCSHVIDDGLFSVKDVETLRQCFSSLAQRSDNMQHAVTVGKAVLELDESDYKTMFDTIRLADLANDSITADSLTENFKNFPLIALYEATKVSAIPSSYSQEIGEKFAVLGKLEVILEEDSSTYKYDEWYTRQIDTGHWGVGFHHSYGANSNAELMAKISKAFRHVLPDLNKHTVWDGGIFTHNRIRIALVTQNIGSSTLAVLMGPMLRDLPREIFEVYIYCVGEVHNVDNLDSNSEFMLNAVDKVIDNLWDLDAAYFQIRNDNIQLVIFNDFCMMPFGYILSYSKLAPIQVLTLNNGFTSGVDTVDYVISSSAEPENGQDFYTEKLIEFPGFYSHEPILPDLDTFNESLQFNRAAMIPECKHLYTIMQWAHKIRYFMDSFIVDLLENDNDACLLTLQHDGQFSSFHSQTMDRLKRKLSESAINRIRTVKTIIPREVFLQIMDQTDILIDTHPFGGGLTSLEGFHLGKLIITWPGKGRSGRLTKTMYSLMNMEAEANEYLIASNAKDMANKARFLITNPEIKLELETMVKLGVNELRYNPHPLPSWSNFLVQKTKEFRPESFHNGLGIEFGLMEPSTLCSDFKVQVTMFAQNDLLKSINLCAGRPSYSKHDGSNVDRCEVMQLYIDGFKVGPMSQLVEMVDVTNYLRQNTNVHWILLMVERRDGTFTNLSFSDTFVCSIESIESDPSQV
eukprot:TRINITY_DN17536_c0_g1_i1.p1 TRINITY_DN17536_c0_g1~~TRINITY_DN17536_c0_g1_i1.p1  ORF type:complete len:718 (+),score=146.24 TRINITY_DN17536_c0_g1_i1:98-2251(+)